ncbi:DUF2155 domain-containing protein [Amorphus sp. 3PC139-8]|uniref:DUF2155 domain-containing protein n=1 Tax=Amorphus sp. 3PC139-8 TaxID=2735676 RepID=UPI00345C67AD
MVSCVRGSLRSAAVGVVLALAATGAHADPIENPIAEFSGLDKITGRIISFDVYVNETVQFGALRVTPRACHTQPPSEEPKTTAFVEVDEITLDNKIQRIFTGWMLASSPGLNAVDHAVYDVWLTDCKITSDVPAPSGFDADAYAQDSMGLITRPDGWFPLPKPKPQPEVYEEPDPSEIED